MSTTSKSPTTEPRPSAKLNSYPSWAPRFWHGMLLSDWVKLVSRHCVSIHPVRLGLAFTVTSVTIFNSCLHALQQFLFRGAVTRTAITQPPVFVIGHWRSGTTMLHELLVLDERFAYPTTYECFAPNHFLVTGRLFPKLLWFLLPSKRPMDNMAVSFDHPQEDEFAMVAMGAPSPMARLAFPNDPTPYMEFLDMQGISELDMNRWQEKLLGFVRMLTYSKNKPIVLKSPPHTGRVQVLSEMFPGAKFVHITRDPYTLFASSRRLWISLDEAQALQIPHHRHLDEFVFTAMERMYGGFESQRAALDPRHIYDLRYEDLVANPVDEVRKIYEHLELGDFDQVRPKIENYWSQKKAYRTNDHQLEPEIKQEIRRRWASYFEKYGYDA